MTESGRHPDVPRVDQAPAISIVIISRNRPDLMRQCLARLQREIAQRPNVEILVVEETDTPQSSPDGVRYLALAPMGQGFGFARNEGLAHARGGIVVFVDDDVRVNQGWLDFLLRSFEDPGVGAVGGAVLPELDAMSDIGGAIGLLGFPAGGLARILAARGESQPSALISSGNCAVRRSVADAAGGFDPMLRWGGEDQEFFHRVSRMATTVFEPRAVVWHHQRNSLGRVWRWAMRRGRAEFGCALKERNALGAAFLPARSNFVLKLILLLVIVVGAGALSPMAAGLLGVGMMLGWCWTVDRRCTKAIGPSEAIADTVQRELAQRLLSRPVRRWLPAVRWCIDAGREVGRWRALTRYLWCRWVDKPMVLTFHHIAPPPASASRNARRFYYNPEHFTRLMHDIAADGRLLIGLPEILHRMEHMPRTLFAEPIVALTFDDAYASACRMLLASHAAVRHASLVFAPTHCLGKTNHWDAGPGWPEEPVADAALITALIDTGVSVGAHTRTHADLNDCPPEELDPEITGPLSDLHALTPTDASMVFAYPYGRYNDDVIRRVAAAGYAGAVANFSGNIDCEVDRFQLPRFAVDHLLSWVAIRKMARRRCGRELARGIRNGMRRCGYRFRKGVS